MRRFAMTLAVMVFAAAAFAGEFTVARVIDGDTIRVWDGETEQTVRLLGIDCPEVRINDKARHDAVEWAVTYDEIVRCGLYARNFVAARIGATVTLETHGLDDYGRSLAYVYLADGRCLNEVLVANGAALAPARYRHRDNDRYAELETAARRERRGFWPNLWYNQNSKGESQ